jgi:superfamily II DNA or RNA helicase
VLTSCALIDEGLDVPAVGAVILLRPTRSLVLHRQQIGRGMRPTPGKAALTVLDHVGSTLLHGPPDLEPQLTLLSAEASGNQSAHRRRDNIGEPEAISMVTLPGRLAELGPAERLAALPNWVVVARFMRGELSGADLRIYAAARRYNPGWVWRRVQEKRAIGG